MTAPRLSCASARSSTAAATSRPAPALTEKLLAVVGVDGDAVGDTVDDRRRVVDKPRLEERASDRAYGPRRSC
jgi:hypothetical protein